VVQAPRNLELIAVQVPRNLKLIAVPIFELHDHIGKYGPVIAALPLLLSRLQFTLAQTSPVAPARPLAAASEAAPDGLADGSVSQNVAPNIGEHSGHGGLPGQAGPSSQEPIGAPMSGGHMHASQYGGSSDPGYGML
jgi:hypothetical protein